MQRIHEFLVEECPRESIYEVIKAGRFDKGQLLLPGSAITLYCRIDGHPLEECIHLTHARTRFNGRRLWFVCPCCRRRCRDLFVTPYLHSWQCRICHKLTHASQRFHRQLRYEYIEKYEHRQKRIEKKLKNKYLRNPTKVMLINEFQILGKLSSYRKKS